jgi:chromate transporter
MPSPGLFQIFISFLRLGLTSFGGPAMVAHIRELSVKKKTWLDEGRFKDGVVLCQTIPGATAMQMAGYVGLRVKGIRGALVSYVGFGLPAFLLMLIFSILYKNYYQLFFVRALFAGFQVMVVAIIAQAAYVFAKTIAQDRHDLWRNSMVALLSAGFLGLGVSPFLVILGAGLISLILFSNPEIVVFPRNEYKRKFIKIILLFILFLVGLALLYLVNPDYLQLSLLMMKIDLFAFGGGFTSLPLMFHEMVEVQRWIGAKILMDGIALGQVTPGPIIVTATFVGYWLYGVAGSLVATISIFTPSFLLLVLVNPVFDRLKASPLFLKATRGVLASFVGLLLYVLIKFSLAVPWEPIRCFLGVAVLLALIKKTNLLYIVTITGVISVWLFSAPA